MQSDQWRRPLGWYKVCQEFCLMLNDGHRPWIGKSLQRIKTIMGWPRMVLLVKMKLILYKMESRLRLTGETSWYIIPLAVLIILMILRFTPATNDLRRRPVMVHKNMISMSCTAFGGDAQAHSQDAAAHGDLLIATGVAERHYMTTGAAP